MHLPKIHRGELVDIIFPMLEGGNPRSTGKGETPPSPRSKEAKSRVGMLPPDETQLKEYLELIEKLVEKEQSRRTSVDARLMSIVGLTSIAATVVLTALFAMAAGTMPLSQGMARWILVLGCFYLALQLYAALLAAVNGLSRAAYVAETPLDLLPKDKASPSFLLRGRISNKIDLLEQHQEENNNKVSQMAVAHRAVKNFLGMLVILAFAASVMALTHELPKEAATCTDVLSKWLATSPNCAAPQAQVSSTSMRSPSAGDDGFSARELLVPCLSLGISVVAIAVGLFFLLAPPPFRRRGVGLALSTGGLVLSLLAGSKFELVALKFDHFIEKLEQRFSVVHNATPREITLVKIVTVGPFPNGDHIIDKTTVIPCVRNALTSYSDQHIVGWQIVGRVDKRQLRADHAAVYGSNQGLAMARAAWVNDVLLSGLPPFDTSAAVVSVGGPRSVGITVRANDLELDRAVDVYVLLDIDKDTRVRAVKRTNACPG